MQGHLQRRKRTAHVRMLVASVFNTFLLPIRRDLRLKAGCLKGCMQCGSAKHAAQAGLRLGFQSFRPGPSTRTAIWQMEAHLYSVTAENMVDEGMGALQVKARGEPAEDDVTIAAHLLRLRDPRTGQPLSDELLAGEFGMFFTAGLETSGNAISWTLCAYSPPVSAPCKCCVCSPGYWGSCDNTVFISSSLQESKMRA